MSRIELRRVTKRFGKTTAVREVSLTVEAGAFLTILGPSGCGKTTLLRIVAGLEEPDDGEVLIDGKVVSAPTRGVYVPPVRRGVGLVYQTYALWPHMTVRSNVAFGLEVLRRPRAEIARRVDGALERMRIPELADRYPHELSGGQQQRVALARMIVTDPRIYLFDEPLSNLDARLRIDMRAELKRLHHDSQATTVFVTHDQIEALTMSTVIAVMRDGVVQQIAEPMAVYRSPANTFVADFIGTPKVNLLDGLAMRNGAGTRLDLGAFDIDGVPVPAAGPVIVGIRPEDITLTMSPAAGAVEFAVHSVLPAGSEIVVNARHGDLIVTAKASGASRIEMDRPVWLAFDPMTVSVFDKATGAAIRGASREEGKVVAT